MYDEPIEDRDTRAYRDPDRPAGVMPGQPGRVADDLVDSTDTGVMPGDDDVDTGVMSAPGGTPESDVMDPRERVTPFIAPARPDHGYRRTDVEDDRP